MGKRASWVWWVWLAAACSAFALCNVFSWYPLAVARRPDFRHAFTWELIRWNLWLPMAAALLKWNRQGSRLRYVALGLGFSTAHTGLLLLLYFPLSPRGLPLMLQRRPEALIPDLLTGVIVTGLILGLAWARAGEVRASRLETQLAQAQLEALRAQVHPHFLFNVLNTISSMEMEERARRMLVRLADFLRLTLESSGAQMVSLAREMEFLSRYLDIERARFSDRLTVEIEVHPDTSAAMVPSLILQPIVENAVRHGVSAKAGPGRVEVHTSRHNGSLLLSVRDTGPGIHGAAREGRGLTITRSRLLRLYGAGASLALENRDAGGLEVRVEIPFRRGPCES